jgi:hypothetical protein
MSERALHHLKYRNIVKLSGYITLGVASLFALIGFFFMVYSMIKLGGVAEVFSGGIFLIWASFFFWAAVIYAQYYFFHRPLMISQIFIYDDKLVIKQKNIEFSISFSEIVKIESAVKKNIGGWFKVVTKKKTWRFTNMLEKADLVLEEIIKKRPELMSREDYQRLRTKLILIDHGQTRYYELFKPPYRIWTLFHTVLIPVITIILIYFKDTSDQIVIHSKSSYFLEIGSHLWVLSIFLQAPFIIAMNWLIDKDSRARLEKDSEDKKRNIQHEISVYRKLFPAYITTYLICLCLYGSSEFYHHYSITNYGKVQGLEYLNDYTVNQKYNCIFCKYQLHKDDRIAYHSWSIGEIIALPGEEVEIKKYSFKNRTLASEGITKVPLGKIAVRGDDGKSIFLLDLSEVNGKITK